MAVQLGQSCLVPGQRLQSALRAIEASEDLNPPGAPYLLGSAPDPTRAGN
jgi:hypothetical protein